MAQRQEEKEAPKIVKGSINDLFMVAGVARPTPAGPEQTENASVEKKLPESPKVSSKNMFTEAEAARPTPAVPAPTSDSAKRFEL